LFVAIETIDVERESEGVDLSSQGCAAIVVNGHAFADKARWFGGAWISGARVI
jgi:hypothetical protein